MKTFEELNIRLQLGDRVLVRVLSVHGGFRHEDGVVEGFSSNRRAVRVGRMNVETQWVPLENIVDTLPDKNLPGLYS